MSDLLQELCQPFAPDAITFKPGKATHDGSRCLAMPYADLRAYQDRLDALCGLQWSVRYEPWGTERVIAIVTICGTQRSSIGEMDDQDKKNGLGGTAAEAQAFKRACAMFGLGRYLYDLPTLWAEWDKEKKRFTPEGYAYLEKSYLAWYHGAQEAQGRGVVEEPERMVSTTTTPAKAKKHDAISQAQLARLHALGTKLYGDLWDEKRPMLVEHVSKGAITSSKELNAHEADVLIKGMEERLRESQTE